jgi:hypothetical protein
LPGRLAERRSCAQRAVLLGQRETLARDRPDEAVPGLSRCYRFPGAERALPWERGWSFSDPGCWRWRGRGGRSGHRGDVATQIRPTATTRESVAGEGHQGPLMTAHETEQPLHRATPPRPTVTGAMSDGKPSLPRIGPRRTVSPCESWWRFWIQRADARCSVHSPSRPTPIIVRLCPGRS